MMIDHLTGWFEITQYNDKRAISITNLFDTTWLSRYPIPEEITYNQRKKIIDHEFIKSLIEMDYRITAKPSSSVNPTSNAILERIHQVLVNIVRTCNIKKSLCWQR